MTSVKTIRPSLKSFSLEIERLGRTVANKKVSIRAMESGELIGLNVDIGDFVHTGDTLAKLYNPIIERTLERDRAVMDVAYSNYQRLKIVYTQTPQLTTIQNFESAEGDYLIANANYESTLSRSDLLSITSPFSGVITKRFVDIGEVIQNSLVNSNAKSLFELSDIQTLRVKLSLPETDVSNLRLGTEANVTFPEMDRFSIFASVSRISSFIDPHNKTMEVQLDILNGEGHILPGMYAIVYLDLASRSEVFTLPQEVLIAENGSFFLFVVEDEFVQRIAIKKGLSNTKYFEVLSSEITADSQIILEGKSSVNIGSKVKVRK
jgi:RND family efflux transporter MFP subunit